MSNDVRSPRSLAWHVVLPALILLGLLVLCERLDLDLKVASLFFDPLSGTWPWRNAWLTETLLHRGGRTGVAVIGLTALAAALTPWKGESRRSWRRNGIYVFLSIVLATSLVGALKSQSGRPCPWDIQAFGGTLAHHGLYAALKSPGAKCFPAGHASAGFALLSLYFVAPTRRLAIAGLVAGFLAGGIFGVAQMARGAHFLSHTLWTAGICWFVVYGLDALMMRRSVSRHAARAADGRSAVGRAMTLVLILLMPAIVIRGEAVPRIASIRIVAHDVFPEAAARNHLGFRTANRLHVSTRESLIRRFLLFREGDVLDPEALAQTERNLRRLEFLESATIRVIPLDENSVEVEVVTSDAWTTDPGVSIGSTGGSGRLGFELTEKNLLGSGRALTLLLDENSERTRMGIELSDPAFLRPYWQADFAWFDNSDGTERRLSLAKPFASIESPWSFELGAEQVDLEQSLYSGGLTIERLRHEQTRIVAQAARRISLSEFSAHRVSAGISLESDMLSHLAGVSVTNDDREFRYITAGYEYIRNGYIKRNYVNRDSRYEDFNLGLHLNADIGWSPAAGDSEAGSGRVRVAASRGWTTGPRSFLLWNGSYGTRFGDTTKNALLDLDTRWIHQYATSLPQTFVVRGNYRRGWELDRNVQLFADGESGLRGYRLHAFDGDEILMVNAEHRISWGREIAHLFTPGAAIFVDSAMVNNPEGRSLLRTDIGVGLRFAVGRSSRNLFRFDLAFPLDPDPLGRRSPLYSFSAGHAF